MCLYYDMVLDFRMEQPKDLDLFQGARYGHSTRHVHSPELGPGPLPLAVTGPGVALGFGLALNMVLHQSLYLNQHQYLVLALVLDVEPDMNLDLYLVPGVHIPCKSELK